MKRILTIAGASAIVAALLSPTPALAATYQFPGTAPCDTTLQACINGVPSGSVIELATNTPIATSTNIQIQNKSLTIRPAAGFQPIIDGPAGEPLMSVRMYAGPGSPATTMKLTGIRLTDLQLVVQSQDDDDSHHEFLVANSSVSHNIAHNNTPGIAVDQRSPSRVQLRNNTVRSNGQQIQIWHISNLGPTEAVVEGNRVSPATSADAYAGIETRADGSSLQTINVFNNVISDSAGCNCGNPGGITTYTPPGANGRFNIVGNTIHSVDLGYAGIMLHGGDPTTQVARVFNNSISNTEGPAIRVSDVDGIKLANDYNNLFKSGAPVLAGRKLGRHTTRLNPRFKNAADDNFRLKSSSPLINRGATCQTGGLGRSDAASHFRLKGANVDIGAYEFGSTKKPPAGRNFFGTNKRNVFAGTGGVDIMCGFGGPDKLNGRGSPDFVYGGGGGDRLIGRGGGDRLYAGKGRRDYVSGGGKADLLVTKDGRRGDTASGGPGNDTCRTDRRDRRRSC